MDKVKWKIDGVINADAQRVYEEIGDKEITPEQLLQKARNKKSELHKCFEWDDSIAAEKYRLHQARRVLQMLVVESVPEEATPLRVFQITSQKNVYMPTRLFLEKPDEYALLLSRAKDELQSLKSRYHMLSELESVFEAIDEL